MASLINEDKRAKEQILRLQKSFEGWNGPDITTTSTRLIYDGILMKISGSKCQERYCYLFDNLFVYCAKKKGSKVCACFSFFSRALSLASPPSLVTGVPTGPAGGQGEDIYR